MINFLYSEDLVLYISFGGDSKSEYNGISMLYETSSLAILQ